MPGGDQSHPGGWVFHHLVRSASINISSLFSSWDFGLFFPLGDHSVSYTYIHMYVEEAGYYCSVFLEGPKLSLFLLYSLICKFSVSLFFSQCVCKRSYFFLSLRPWCFGNRDMISLDLHPQLEW